MVGGAAAPVTQGRVLSVFPRELDPTVIAEALTQPPSSPRAVPSSPRAVPSSPTVRTCSGFRGRPAPVPLCSVR